LARDRLWRIDFTRAFRTYKELQYPNDPVRCDRQLFEKLKALDANELAEKTKPHLTKDEMKAVMTPRDAIVQHFRMLYDAAITAHRWMQLGGHMKMHRTVLWMTMYVAFVVAVIGLAHTKNKIVDIPIVAERPEDVSTIEAIVKADYESISGGVGVPRQWARDLSLHVSGARSFSPYKDSESDALLIWSPTMQEYANGVDAHYVKNGFVEHELSHKIYRFGNVATVFSSYEGKMTSTGEIYSRGVNIYQLCFDGTRWWIVSVSWDDESPINTIPPELLPKT